MNKQTLNRFILYTKIGAFAALLAVQFTFGKAPLGETPLALVIFMAMIFYTLNTEPLQ